MNLLKANQAARDYGVGGVTVIAGLGSVGAFGNGNPGGGLVFAAVAIGGVWLYVKYDAWIKRNYTVIVRREQTDVLTPK